MPRSAYNFTGNAKLEARYPAPLDLAFAASKFQGSVVGGDVYRYLPHLGLSTSAKWSAAGQRTSLARWLDYKSYGDLESMVVPTDQPPGSQPDRKYLRAATRRFVRLKNGQFVIDAAAAPSKAPSMALSLSTAFRIENLDFSDAYERPSRTNEGGGPGQTR